MSTRIKDSIKQKWLVDYIKSGAVPEGYYVKETKNNTIQFRRIKQPPTNDDIEKKIKRLEAKIKQLRDSLSSGSTSDDVA